MSNRISQPNRNIVSLIRWRAPLNLSKLSLTALFFAILFLSVGEIHARDTDYAAVQKLFTKYCAGCHNATEANGDFAIQTFKALMTGGETGAALTAGSSKSSRIVQMMQGKLEPTMPPDGEPQPSNDEIQLIVDWIDAGAPGPDGISMPLERLDAPDIESQVSFQPVTAMVANQQATQIAVARFRKIEIRELSSDDLPIMKTFGELPGKVASMQFLRDGKRILVGTGTAGLSGEIWLLNIVTGEVEKRFKGHGDMVYSIAISPDEKHFASGSYDRTAKVWSFETGDVMQTLKGHNDSVFDCQFAPDGQLLLTASADATVKIWRVVDGVRLDTRGEPLGEQYSLVVAPDGRSFFAGGQDNRIRKWDLVSTSPNQINPIAAARYGHESAIQLLRFHPDNRHLVSVADDGAIKIWDSESMTEVHRFENQSESVQTLVVMKDRLLLGRMDGSIAELEWPKSLNNVSTSRGLTKTNDRPVASTTSDPSPSKDPVAVNESEPNSVWNQAQDIPNPAVISGTIDGEEGDSDYFRFEAKKGERLVIIAKAASKNSPIDTAISILDANGHPVPRILLQAVRDSYFTFRGKNSTQTGDFRIFNWEEMELNQLLYCNGEVVRLFHYPRGPDSGFNVYPNFGQRQGMFDTTAISHALGEPCYVVESHLPGTKLPATGLPQFLINYENDDDAERELGTNSRLTFQAPEDGSYIIKLVDSRNFSGDSYQYQLSISPEKPSFRIKSIGNSKPTLLSGGYRKMSIVVDRIDNFMGPIEIQIDDLPEGVTAHGPIQIESGQLRCHFPLHAAKDVEIEADAMSATITAIAKIDGRTVRDSRAIGPFKIQPTNKLSVELKHAPESLPHFDDRKLPVLEIRPGETISALVRVNRTDYDQRVNFGKEDAALNLPFGVYVANTGLNGVLIPPKENERIFCLTAESWIEPSERLIFLEAAEAGKPCSNPAILRVLPKKTKDTSYQITRSDR